MYVCMYVYLCMYIHKHTYIHKHHILNWCDVYVLIQLIYVCIYIYIHIYVCIYINIYTYINITPWMGVMIHSHSLQCHPVCVSRQRTVLPCRKLHGTVPQMSWAVCLVCGDSPASCCQPGYACTYPLCCQLYVHPKHGQWPAQTWNGYRRFIWNDKERLLGCDGIIRSEMWRLCFAQD